MKLFVEGNLSVVFEKFFDHARENVERAGGDLIGQRDNDMEVPVKNHGKVFEKPIGLLGKVLQG